MCNKLGKQCKMADFDKVCTGHKCWTAQWPAVRVRAHACVLA